ncbi:hypothetical protein [Nannocystis pusilla]|uniref:hypothetical protein n=1 Tax=Nannocystis pusilla TaxID=889268 RepID=UPI003B77B104
MGAQPRPPLRLDDLEPRRRRRPRHRARHRRPDAQPHARAARRGRPNRGAVRPRARGRVRRARRRGRLPHRHRPRAREWRTLLPDGRLRREGQVALEFSGGAIECAAFDLAGDRLLLVNRDALHVVDVAHGLLLAQLDLRPLAPALALPESLPRELADLLLAHHGTLAAALAQPDACLRELGLDDAQLADLRAEPPLPPIPALLHRTGP